MREEIGIREVRADLAAAARRAGAGDRIVITIGGRPVASLGPLEPVGGQATLAELAATGQVIPPRRHDQPLGVDAIDVPVDVRLSNALEEVRGR